MVDFSRLDVSESGGCRSRWWTRMLDSGSGSSIPVIYRAGFVSLRTRIFFFLLHASRSYATSIQCVQNFNFEAASRILSLCHAWIPRVKKKKQIFISELHGIFLFYSRFLCTCDRNPWCKSNTMSYRTVNSDLFCSILSESSNILLTLSKWFSTSDSNYVDSLMYIVKLRITVC